MAEIFDFVKFPTMTWLWLKVTFLCGLLLMIDACAAKAIDESNQGFTIEVLGDGHYGENDMGIWTMSGKIRVGVSDSLIPDLNGFHAVGAMEAFFSHDELGKARVITDNLCKFVDPGKPATPARDGQWRYSVQCLKNGTMISYGGALEELPIDLRSEAVKFYQQTFSNYCRKGRPLVKIQAEISEVRRTNNKFLVGLRFINSGKYPVSIPTPDEWRSPRFDRLDVTGWGDASQWNADLVGAQVINKSELSTWVLNVGNKVTFVTVPPGGDIVFKILAVPNDKVPKGNYRFGAMIFTGMITRDETGDKIENDTLNLGAVDFVTRNRNTFVFDSDYPSTPDEWREFEAHKRAQQSGRAVTPGHQFAEDGYYRLVSDSGQRGQFVTKFKRGRTAEIGADSLDDQGKPFSGRLAWQWEADSALEATCDPNQPCPRDGHWVALTRDYGWLDERYTLYADTKRYFRAGEIMPEKRSAYGEQLRYLSWYWLGI